MGLKSRNIIFIISLLVIVVLLSTCDKSTINGTNCIECLSTPDSAQLNIRVTLNDENKAVPIVVYLGKFNPKRLPPIFVLDTATTGTLNVIVPTNHFYSVKAAYISGRDTIYAIDGGDFQTQQQGACDNICWQVIGGNYDLRLK